MTDLTAPRGGYDIRPKRGLFDLNLRDVWRYRELFVVLMMRDIQVLYKQAALGVAWAVIQPIFAVLIFSTIFGAFARMPSDGAPYPVFVFAGVLAWTYFSEAVRRSATGLVTDAELVRKIYFPRLVMPLANVASPLLDLALGFVVFLVVLLAFGVSLSFKLLLLPVLALVTTLLALAIGLWLAPLNVRFRDIKHTLPFLLQVWMYASPVVYPLSIVPENLRWIVALNPMVGVIEGFRWALVGAAEPHWDSILVSAVVAVFLLIGGIVFFRSQESTFADHV